MRTPKRSWFGLSSVLELARNAEGVRRRTVARGYQGYVWESNVSCRGGALIVALLGPTRVSPNIVTLLGLAVFLVGALCVLQLEAPVSIGNILVVLVLWQLAYCLDCADGQLARERNQTSEFGAWLDQLADGVAHVAVLATLVAFIVRALSLPVLTALLLVAALIGANLIRQFGWALRLALMGRPSVAETVASRSGPIRLLAHLNDYGIFLFVCSVLLLAPTALLIVLLLAMLFWAGSIGRQVARSWPRHPLATAVPEG